ncbi:hypothetical protein ACQY0O_001728 [Thecaphora frezii]
MAHGGPTTSSTMPPRRNQRAVRPTATAATAGQRAMYNLGIASSSGGSLVGRNPDGTAAPHANSSSSLPSISHPVSAAEAPYLTNVESHFGRITLTAPDNMRRKQAKEKKLKMKQKKNQSAKLAAAALAGASSSPRADAAQANDAAGPSTLTRPAMQRAFSSGYTSSGNITPTSSSGRRTPTGHTVENTAATRTRARPASNSRLAVSATSDGGAAQRPPSRTAPRTAERPSRLVRARSQTAGNRAATPSQSRQGSTDSFQPSRNRIASALGSEDAAAATLMSATPARASAPNLSSAPISAHTPTTAAAAAGISTLSPRASPGTSSPATGDQASISSAMAQQASLRRYNIWNDIAGLPGADEPDPDDLPPPFPEGATRPRTPPQPPPAGREWTEQERLAYEEAERWRVPDSPPPAFRTDPESDGSDREDESRSSQHGSTARRAPRSEASRATRRTTTPMEAEDRDQASGTPEEQDPSSQPDASSSESPSSEAEPEDLAEERRAWEADLQAGLSFEERLLREQERREVRERALLMASQEAAGPAWMPVELLEASTEDADRRTVAQLSEADWHGSAAGPAPLSAAEIGLVQPGDEERLSQRQIAEAANADPVPAAPTQGNSAQSAPATVGEVVTQAPAITETPTEAASAVEGVRRPLTNETGAAPTTIEPLVTIPASRLVQALRSEPRLDASSAGNAGLHHQRTASDDLTQLRNVIARKRASTGRDPTQVPSRPASESRSRFRDEAAVAAERRSHLWARAPRRPEDVLLPVTAPPARFATSGEQPLGYDATSAADAELSRSTVGVASSSDEADGLDGPCAESDSSTDQWLAEAAAFESLRRKEQEAAEKLRRLRVVPQDGETDSSSEDEGDAAQRIPGHFESRRRSAPATAAASTGLDRLAMLEKTVARAPPPLVLGRSRGGAAYSSSSSESTDSDEGRLPSSSGSQEDEEAANQGGQLLPFAAGTSALVANPITAHPLQAPGVSAPRSELGQEPTGPSLHQQLQTARTASVAPSGAFRGAAEASDARPWSTKAQATGPARPGPSDTNVPGAKATGLARQDTLYIPIALRMAEEPSPTVQTRAGHFQEDSSSSRDVSSAEDGSPVAGAPPSSTGRLAASSRPPLRSGSSTESYNKGPIPLPLPEQRASLEAASNPSGSHATGKAPVGSRLRGLFGTPLVEPPLPKAGAQPLIRAASLKGKGKEPVRPDDFVADGGSTSSQRRSSAHSSEAERRHQPDAEDQTATGPSSSLHPTSLQKRPSASSLHDTASGVPSLSNAPHKVDADAASLKTAVRKKSSASSSERAAAADEPTEQRARDEALTQIAQLQSTSAARNDSLIALEHLLARTSRPMSMQPMPHSASPGSIHASDVAQPRTLGAGDGPLASPAASAGANSVGAASNSANGTATDPQQPPRWPGANQLFRQGAVHRARDGSDPPPPPPISYNMRPSTRPASFINPRSSAAPLPRGRLPTITDATRHFPPSSANAGVVRTPSWLAHIPGAERSRLPPPLEPKRLSSSGTAGPGRNLHGPGPAANLPPPAPPRPAGSRVSAMISRFEPPTSPQPALVSRFEASAGAENRGRSVSNESQTAAVSTIAPDPSAGPGAVLRAREEALSRRPPPPPPSVGSSQGASPSQSRRPLSTSSAPPARTQPNPMNEPAADVAAASSSSLAPPAAVVSMLPRSPRTQTLDVLTQREAGTAGQRPSAPPKSPLLSADQLFHPSQKGLDETLAAAHAASQSRRDQRQLTENHFAADPSGFAGPSSSVHPPAPPPQLREQQHPNSLPVPSASSRDAPPSRPASGLFGPVFGECSLGVSSAPSPSWPQQRLSAARSSAASSPVRIGALKPLPELPTSVRQWGAAVDAPTRPTMAASTSSDTPELHSAGTGYSSSAPPRPPPTLPARPRNRVWEGIAATPIESSTAASPQAPGTSLPTPPRTAQESPELQAPSPAQADARASLDEDREISPEEEARAASSPSVAAAPSAANLIHAAASAIGRSGSVRSATLPRGGASATAAAAAGPSNAARPAASASASATASASAAPAADDADSLVYTDLDLLVSRLESLQSGGGGEGGGAQGNDYELLTTLSEFLGPAKPTVATVDEISTLPLAKVECERRRVTREGKVKQKLSVVGLRVDRCGVCLEQFRTGNWAAVCRCGHVLHEGCATRLFRMVRTCPTCRKDCFRDDDEAGGRG